jgi:hypothetical protein
MVTDVSSPWHQKLTSFQRHTERKSAASGYLSRGAGWSGCETVRHLTGIARLNCLAPTRLGSGATELIAATAVDTLYYLAYLLIA